MPSTSGTRKLRLALSLFETGRELMRQNLRRRHPNADSDEIARRLRSWLRERPGAEYGDCPGRIVPADRFE